MVHQHGTKRTSPKALNDIKNITWTPAWGQNRIEAMIDGRPDWCISRQRTWGVPITFYPQRNRPIAPTHLRALLKKPPKSLKRRY